MVADIRTGAEGSNPAGVTYIGRGRVVFSATWNNGGREPWISDGTAAGTFRLVNANPGSADSYPEYFTRVNDRKFMFSAERNGQTRIWISDGTSGGTVRFHNHLWLDEPSGIARLADKRVVFSAQNRRNANAISRGWTLWATDGTSEGTTEIFRPNGQHFNQVNEIKPIGAGFAVFRALNRNSGWELYLTDGTAQGTSLLKDTNPSGDGWPMLFAVIQRMHDHD